MNKYHFLSHDQRAKKSANSFFGIAIFLYLALLIGLLFTLALSDPKKPATYSHDHPKPVNGVDK